ncbi:anion exchange protein 2-like [Homarus americanus]|uniref:anion exchange protein 2-like n=1 Tax=Homarus americanus TaxID=6706 RepID=UPI001C436CDC|nr:anion exchange protein 2-like [Homarus americanus]
MEKISSLANMPVYDEETRQKRHSSEQMNEDMERMFEDGTAEDFSISQLTGDAPAAASALWSPGYNDVLQICESDGRIRDVEIKYHRRDTFPHVHHPLRPHHHRRGSRRGSQSDDSHPSYSRLDKEGEEEEEEEAANHDPGVSFQVGEPEPAVAWSPGILKDDIAQPATASKPPSSPRKIFTGVLDSDIEEQSPLLADEDAKLRPCIRPTDSDLQYIDESSRKKTRVQFDIGEDEQQPDLEHRTRRRRSAKARRRGDTVEDPAWRRHAGSEHSLQSHMAAAAAPTTDEEAKNLVEHDLDDMSSHRFDDPSAYRRPKVRARSSVSSIIHASDKEEGKADRQGPLIKKAIDHSPHEVFVELDELKYTENGFQWKETARWIKYEEDVEDVDNRWGKPHLAFLNFHALFSLRKGLEAGKVACSLQNATGFDIKLQIYFDLVVLNPSFL